MYWTAWLWPWIVRLVLLSERPLVGQPSREEVFEHDDLRGAVFDCCFIESDRSDTCLGGSEEKPQAALTRCAAERDFSDSDIAKTLFVRWQAWSFAGIAREMKPK